MATWGRTVLERLRSPELEALAAEPGVWVVGGAVRDALLGREPREIDLAVEGDAAALARRLGTAPVVHDRFGTATVAGMDVARIRTERYERPGALPAVAPAATIDEDLGRRDFSVNAMAVRLADAAEAAWPGALEDLEARRLRVLHPRSFLDDPTRLLRLARYAARLGFDVEPETDRLAREAIASDAPATVSGSRLGAELRLLAREPQPAALGALAERGLGRALLGHFDFDGERVTAALGALPEDGRAELAGLGAGLLGHPDPRPALDRLAFPAGERDVLAACAGAARLAAALEAARTPADVAAVARAAPPEALAVAAALGPAEPVRRWLAEWRHVRLRISGDDLVAAGLRGPAVGAGLRAALAAVLDGRAPSREDELRAALDTLGS
ncbi:MAG TPA: hypothetical protein VM266_06600 [Solirubrobacteraceae bacterium]|nr:hypothetical protein [Solirubrobacteraceae bacterium]